MAAVTHSSQASTCCGAVTTASSSASSSSAAAAAVASTALSASSTAAYPKGFVRKWNVTGLKVLTASSTYSATFLTCDTQHVFKVSVTGKASLALQAEVRSLTYLKKEGITDTVVELEDHFPWGPERHKLHPDTATFLNQFPCFRNAHAYILVTKNAGTRLSEFKHPIVSAVWHIVHLWRLIAALVPLLEKLEKNFLIHGDLKPDNIVYTEDANYTVLDWVSLYLYSKELKQIPFHAPTLWYKPPELVFGGNPLRNDMWAFGLICYETIMGQPFVNPPAHSAKGREDENLISMLISRLGFPPARFVDQSSKPLILKYFSEEEVNRWPKKQAEFPYFLKVVLLKELCGKRKATEKEAEELIALIEACLKWVPEERVRAEAIVKMVPSIAKYIPTPAPTSSSSASAAASAAAQAAAKK